MSSLNLDLIPELREAVRSGALVLHFQPEVDLTCGSVVGMEALLRWQHPQRGLLWPREFLAVAEAAGLMPDIGRWVLDSCIREAAAWSRLPGRPLAASWAVWLNVTASQLSEPGFPGEVAERIAAAGLPPRRLGLEVTEESLNRLGGRARGVLEELRATGVLLGVDDFGTWYSSLATLQELPVDALKLDRSFVRGVGSDMADDTIVESVIRLAHAHELYVVAEGVESWTEGARLCELGCDRALGYLFSGPQRADRARDMLARGFGWRAGAGAAGAVSGGTVMQGPSGG